MDQTNSMAGSTASGASFCGQCGFKNVAGFNFCQQCGEAGSPKEAGSTQPELNGVHPGMTLSKAAGIYAGSIGLHIAAYYLLPNALVLLYLASGYVMTRIVMRGLIEWHPNYNTLDNVVSAKIKMFVLWPLQMAVLLAKLAFNKLM